MNEDNSPKQRVRRIKKDIPNNFSKVYLRFADFKCKEFLQVKSVILNNLGSTSVIFYDSSTKQYHPQSYSINLSIDLYNDLIDILGEENVVPK